MLPKLFAEINFLKYRHVKFMNWKTVVKMSVLLKCVYGFHTFSMKIQADFIIEIKKMILQFIWTCKELILPKKLLK